MCVCVCLSENGVYRLPLPVIEHNYWTWIKLSLIYLLTKKVIFRGYLGHISQLTVVIHPPVWTAPSNSLNQLTQILLMADVDNLSPKDQKKCGSNESPVWPGSFPVLLMVIFHFYPHVQMLQTNPLFGGSLPSGLVISDPKMENLDSNDRAPQKDAEHVLFQLVQEYVTIIPRCPTCLWLGAAMYLWVKSVHPRMDGWAD